MDPCSCAHLQADIIALSASDESADLRATGLLRPVAFLVAQSSMPRALLACAMRDLCYPRGCRCLNTFVCLRGRRAPRVCMLAGLTSLQRRAFPQRGVLCVAFLVARSSMPLASPRCRACAWRRTILDRDKLAPPVTLAAVRSGMLLASFMLFLRIVGLGLCLRGRRTSAVPAWLQGFCYACVVAGLCCACVVAGLPLCLRGCRALLCLRGRRAFRSEGRYAPHILLLSLRAGCARQVYLTDCVSK